MVDSAPEVDSALLGFDSGYVIVSLRRPGYCFRFQRNAWSSVVHAMRQSPGAFGQTAQKTVDFLQLPFFAGSPISCCSAESDSHGLAFSEDHRDSAVAVFAWWSMFLLCRSCSMPVVVDKGPWLRSCRNSRRFRSRSSSGCGRRCIMQRHVVSRQ